MKLQLLKKFMETARFVSRRNIGKERFLIGQLIDLLNWKYEFDGSSDDPEKFRAHLDTRTLNWYIYCFDYSLMGLKEVSVWVKVFQDNMGFLTMQYRRFKDNVNNPKR